MEVVVLGFAQIRRRLSLKLWSTKACLVQAGFDIRQPGRGLSAEAIRLPLHTDAVFFFKFEGKSKQEI